MLSSAAEKANRQAQCASQWDELAASAGRDLAGLEVSWKGRSGQCAGTGIFEYRLATLAEINGRRDEGIAILERAVQENLPLKDEMRAVLLGMRFSKAQFATPRESARARQAHDELEALLVENPSLVPAMHQLAMQRLELKNFTGAAEMSRRAISHDPNAWQPRRTLFLALVASRDYAEARPLIRPALELHERLFSDVEFMLAASFCYLKVGDLKTAEQVLRALQVKVPDVSDEEDFRQMVRLVNAEKEKAASAR